MGGPLHQALSRKLEINSGIMGTNNTVEKFAKTILQTSLNKRKNNIAVLYKLSSMCLIKISENLTSLKNPDNCKLLDIE